MQFPKIMAQPNGLTILFKESRVGVVIAVGSSNNDIGSFRREWFMQPMEDYNGKILVNNAIINPNHNEFPRLWIGKQSNRVILAVRPRHQSHNLICGTVIHQGNMVGSLCEYSEGWDKGQFREFNGNVLLKNKRE